MLEAVDQLYTSPANQSEQIALSEKRGFMETGTKQSITYR